MLGMGASSGARLLEPPQIVGKVGRERVGLHEAVGVEAHDEVLADRARAVALDVQPSPGWIAVLEADLVGLTEHPLEPPAVAAARYDPARVGRGKLAPDPDRDTAGEEGERDQTHQPPGRAHAAEYESGQVLCQRFARLRVIGNAARARAILRARPRCPSSCTPPRCLARSTRKAGCTKRSTTVGA